ncbi:hypothetical protein ADIWIN_0613 [Winogradskyella psychrotolerans RS-3]|uniref:Uncharacterized protein n=1 Tax=Winogradskyella psychrotolerans RS-3 TaxID=641526 RepID=S7VVZ5_9FLAO|nr:hypothetical protein ADIWIN_0613 [Winogradskyella psychrotolerans RS-3]
MKHEWIPAFAGMTKQESLINIIIIKTKNQPFTFQQCYYRKLK